MNDFSVPDVVFVNNIVDWIEAHGNTVDLLKWLALGALAWFVGGFKYLREKFRRGVATLEVSPSRCFIEEIPLAGGDGVGVRASFLIEMGIANPTSERLVVRSFSLSIRRRSLWKSWTPQLSPLSIPARPQQEFANGELRLMKNWFSKFNDGFDDLTIKPEVEPKDHHSGFLFFVLFDKEIFDIRIRDETVEIKGRVFLTTGEVCAIRGRIKVTRDEQLLESRVPGITAQIRHPSSWGAVRDM